MMKKSTGVVRKIDELGRIVLPIELRRTLDLNEGDPVEFYVDGEEIIVKKYIPGCCFCGKLDSLKQIHGKKICPDCVEKIIGLKPGDKVKMVNCLESESYPDKVWTVASEPWTVCGTEVVKLEGKAGGFATEFLEKVK